MSLLTTYLLASIRSLSFVCGDFEHLGQARSNFKTYTLGSCYALGVNETGNVALVATEYFA